MTFQLSDEFVMLKKPSDVFVVNVLLFQLTSLVPEICINTASCLLISMFPMLPDDATNVWKVWFPAHFAIRSTEEPISSAIFDALRLASLVQPQRFQPGLRIE